MKERKPNKSTRQGLRGHRLRQFIEYQIGGGAYFWSAWLIITFMTPRIGLWWSNILGNIVGISLNFIIQQFLTFGGNKHVFNSGWRFAVITVFNLIVSYFILKLLVGLGIKLWFAQFLSAGIFTIWNWVVYKYWVFKERV